VTAESSHKITMRGQDHTNTQHLPQTIGGTDLSLLITESSHLFTLSSGGVGGWLAWISLERPGIERGE